MILAFSLVLFVCFMHLMSTTLVVILSIVSAALFVVEGVICGKITAELVHKKDAEINQVMWFWLGFTMSFVAIILTLIVKSDKKNN